MMKKSNDRPRAATPARVNLADSGGVHELRRMIRERRGLVERMCRDAPLNGRKPTAVAEPGRLEELRLRLELHRNALEFDLASPVPVIGIVLTSVKRFIQRLFRSYLARQSAFNESSLALSAALADEHRRRTRDFQARIEYLELRLELLEKTLAGLTESEWGLETKERRQPARAAERNASR